MVRFALGFVSAILALAAVGLILMYAGTYNVSASARHSAIEDWVLTTTMRNSVQRRAGEVAVPARITEEQVRRGSSQFRDSCVYCHGAPGVDATDWAQAIRPEPPYLPDVTRGRTPAQLFWIVRNGINMTAMPAFGKHLGDQEIWGLVGFIQRLPEMSAEEYARLGREADEAGQAAGTAEEPAASPSR